MTAGHEITDSASAAAEQQPMFTKGGLRSHHISTDADCIRTDSPATSVCGGEADEACPTESVSTADKQGSSEQASVAVGEGIADVTATAVQEDAVLIEDASVEDQQQQGEQQQDEEQPSEQDQEQQDACTADMQKLSASEANTSAQSKLRSNIEGKGQHSYYYAHKRKDTGEEPAPLPVAVVLERSIQAPVELFTTIFSYQFLDEKEHVKVYIPLDGVGAAIDDAGVVTSFQDSSCELLIRGYKPQVLRLTVKALHGSIVPELCKARKFANKVTLTLVKKPSEAGTYSSWSKLTV